MTKTFWLTMCLCIFAFACGTSEESEEEPSGSTTAAQQKKCPSPVDDREGFVACVRAAGQKSSSSSGGNSGNGGTARESKNGGSIEIGDITTTGCGSISIQCTDDGCTCSKNGGPRQTCNGNDCASICCAK